MNRYFDNAATSFPKPEGVGREMLRYLEQVGGSYGRSSHGHALEVSRTIEGVRDQIACVLGAGCPEKVVFSANGTSALNMALRSLVGTGELVFTTSLEHNAVMRPLRALEAERGIRRALLPSHPDGLVNVAELPAVVAAKPALVVVNQQSNVNGVIQPLAEIRSCLSGIPLVIDASQSLGAVPIRVDDWNLDAVAWTGHKSLLGPTGTGGLYMRDPERFSPAVYGGTGSRSEEYQQPEFLPDRFEAGTPNIVGLFGLGAALTASPVPGHRQEDWLAFLGELRQLPGVTVLAASDEMRQGSVMSLTHDRLSPADIGERLWRDYGLAVRVGLHCAPLAHRTLGTFPTGTVRLSTSVYHTNADFRYAFQALSEICSR